MTRMNSWSEFNYESCSELLNFDKKIWTTKSKMLINENSNLTDTLLKYLDKWKAYDE